MLIVPDQFKSQMALRQIGHRHGRPLVFHASLLFPPDDIYDIYVCKQLNWPLNRINVYCSIASAIKKLMSVSDIAHNFLFNFTILSDIQNY